MPDQLFVREFLFVRLPALGTAVSRWNDITVPYEAINGAVMESTNTLVGTGALYHDVSPLLWFVTWTRKAAVSSQLGQPLPRVSLLYSATPTGGPDNTSNQVTTVSFRILSHSTSHSVSNRQHL
jgi:hypothetical protein